MSALVYAVATWRVTSTVLATVDPSTGDTIATGVSAAAAALQPVKTAPRRMESFTMPLPIRVVLDRDPAAFLAATVPADGRAMRHVTGVTPWRQHASAA